MSEDCNLFFENLSDRFFFKFLAKQQRDEYTYFTYAEVLKILNEALQETEEDIEYLEGEMNDRSS